jgi:hypothetical protein
LGLLKYLQRRLSGEAGFSIVEAMISISILAIGAFAVSQAIGFSLTSTGLARERLGARAAIEEQLEEARALAYDAVVLSDSTTIPHSSDTANPDYYVNASTQTYDPDGSGPIGAESLYRVAGANPGLKHYQAPVIRGNVTFAVYAYVTWVNSTTDDVGGVDSGDGNNDGVSDANGHDSKRVTIVVTWTDPVSGDMQQSKSSSMFSGDMVPYEADEDATATNLAPTVSCPSSTHTGFTYAFTAVASDPDGHIVRYDWKVKQNGTTIASYNNQGTTLSYTFVDEGTYTIENTVYDDDAETATNVDQSCSVIVVATSDSTVTGSVVISGGATYTPSTLVTLTLASSTATKMQFSSDGSTWSAKQDYATSVSYTLSTGDGTKTVYARFWIGNSRVGPSTSDTIVLDTTAPGAPTGLTATSGGGGTTRTLTLQWTAPNPLASDFAGYRVYVKTTTQTTYSQAACTFVTATKCTTTGTRNITYSFYVVSYDLAGNQSAQSNIAQVTA